VLGFLCFLATFKSFLQDTVKCVDITTKQYSLYPSLINIFQITNKFLAKYPIFCCCLVPGRRREIPGRKGGLCGDRKFASSLQSQPVNDSSLIIHSWFIFKPKKHLLLLFKSLQTKEKSNSLHGVGNTFNKRYKLRADSALEIHARSWRQWGLSEGTAS